MEKYTCSDEAQRLLVALRKMGYHPQDTISSNNSTIYFFDKIISMNLRKQLEDGVYQVELDDDEKHEIVRVRDCEDSFVFKHSRIWLDYIFLSSKRFTVFTIAAFITLVLTVLPVTSFHFLNAYLEKYGLKSDVAHIYSTNLNTILIHGYFVPAITTFFLVALILYGQAMILMLLPNTRKESLQKLVKVMFIPLLITLFIIWCLILLARVTSFDAMAWLTFVVLFIPAVVYSISNRNTEPFNKAQGFQLTVIGYLIILYSVICTMVIHKSTGNIYSNALFVLAILFGTSMVLLVFIFSPFILKFFSPGKATSKFELCLRLIVFTSFFAAVWFMYILLGVTNIVTASGLGGFNKNIYVNSDFNQYTNIVKVLNYDKKSNQIRPWVILNTTNFMALSKSKDAKVVYKFQLIPFKLLSIDNPIRKNHKDQHVAYKMKFNAQWYDQLML